MSYFETNLAALRLNNPALAQAVQGVQPAPEYQLAQAENGMQTLWVGAPDGSRTAWHDQQDPMKQVERELSLLDHTKIYTPFFMGIGLGYSLRYLWDKHRDEFFSALILERDPNVLRLAMEVTRMDDILANTRVKLVAGGDLSGWHETCRAMITPIVSSELQVIPHQPSRQRYGAFYNQAFKTLHDQIRLTEAEFRLMVRSGETIQDNLWRNLPAILASAGVDAVRGAWSGKTAVIAAAGPSLDKNVAQLKEARDRCLLIAVDTACRTLLENGVAPHIVVSTDPTELNLKHFDGVEHAPETVLAFDPEVYYAIPARWRQRRLYLNIEKAVFTRWVDEIGKPLGFIEKGNSVGHTAFFLARALGSDPIVFVGLDLAFDPDGGRTHSAAAALSRTHGKIEDGVTTAPLDPVAGIAVTNEDIRWVAGVTRESVPTSNIMSIYINQFAKDFRETKARVIDATEGGAIKPGAETLPLSAVVEMIKNAPGDPAELLRLIQPAQRDTAAIKKLVLHLIQILRQSAQQAQMGLGKCSVLEAREHVGPALRSHSEWQEMEQCFNAIYYANPVKIAMEQALFSATYVFIKKERPDEVKLRIQKYKNYFQSYLQCLPRFLKRIEEVAGEL